MILQLRAWRLLAALQHGMAVFGDRFPATLLLPLCVAITSMLIVHAYKRVLTLLICYPAAGRGHRLCLAGLSGGLPAGDKQPWHRQGTQPL